MNANRQRWFKAANSRRLLAGLLFGLFLSVLAMAQFETLHRLAHADAKQPGHQCAVTTLQSGQVDTPACAGVVAIAPVRVIAQTLIEHSFVPSVDYSLLPGRGPPAILL